MHWIRNPAHKTQGKNETPIKVFSKGDMGKCLCLRSGICSAGLTTQLPFESILMSGEWIKMRTNLWNDPRVSQICDLTQTSEAAVVGALYWLWASADEHTQTGHMPGLSITAIDRKTGLLGFGAALVAINWIQDHESGITIVGFTDHNGASAKTRAQTAKRVANHKTRKNETLDNQTTNDDRVNSALPREEKRREEKEEEKKTPLNSKAESSQRGSRLPEDWKPSDVDIEYCKTQRPDLRPSLVATNFYDYWIAKPGKDARKLDWSAAWRMWVRKESVQNAPRSPPSLQLTLADQNAINNAEAKRLLGISNDDGRTIDAA